MKDKNIALKISYQTIQNTNYGRISEKRERRIEHKRDSYCKKRGTGDRK